VLIPAGKTVAILLYSSAYYYTTYYNYYTQFMHWYIFNFRSAFLTTGLEVDVERTLKAWQCRGYQNSFDIWK
jgi:ABC-type multidrug transport system permease subunit